MRRPKKIELTARSSNTRPRSNAFCGTPEFNQRGASAEPEQKTADDSNTPPLRREFGCRNLITKTKTKPNPKKPSWRQNRPKCKRVTVSEPAAKNCSPRC